jgi:hypothetical protein
MILLLLLLLLLLYFNQLLNYGIQKTVEYFLQVVGIIN